VETNGAVLVSMSTSYPEPPEIEFELPSGVAEKYSIKVTASQIVQITKAGMNQDCIGINDWCANGNSQCTILGDQTVVAVLLDVIPQARDNSVCPVDIGSSTMCLNAQDCYRFSTWAVSLKPNVEDEDIDALLGANTENKVPVNALVCSGGSPLQGAVSDGECFRLVPADVSLNAPTGEYSRLLTPRVGNVEVAGYIFCAKAASGQVFRFKFADLVSSTCAPEDGSGYGVESFDCAAKTVKCGSHSAGVNAWATSSQNYKLRVQTEPANSYSGNVRAIARVSHAQTGEVIIWKSHHENGNTVGTSVTLDFGPIGLTWSSGGGGSKAIAMCALGAGSMFEGELELAKDLFQMSSGDFDSFWWDEDGSSGKQNLVWFSEDPRDVAVGGRLYQSGVTEVNLRTRIGITSKTTRPYSNPPLAESRGCSVSTESFIRKDTDTVEAKNGLFKIVP
jgi:hypothetical protein